MQILLILAIFGLGLGVDFFYGPQRITYPMEYEENRADASAHTFLDFQRAVERYISKAPATNAAQLASGDPVQILQNAGYLPSNYGTLPVFLGNPPPWGVVMSGKDTLIHTGAPGNTAANAGIWRYNSVQTFRYKVQQGLQGLQGVGVVRDGQLASCCAQGERVDTSLPPYQGNDRNALNGNFTAYPTPGVPEGALVIVRRYVP